MSAQRGASRQHGRLRPDRPRRPRPGAAADRRDRMGPGRRPHHDHDAPRRTSRRRRPPGQPRPVPHRSQGRRLPRSARRDVAGGAVGGIQKDAVRSFGRRADRPPWQPLRPVGRLAGVGLLASARRGRYTGVLEEPGEPGRVQRRSSAAETISGRLRGPARQDVGVRRCADGPGKLAALPPRPSGPLLAGTAGRPARRRRGADDPRRRPHPRLVGRPQRMEAVGWGDALLPRQRRQRQRAASTWPSGRRAWVRPC